MPPELATAVREPYAARAVILALLIDEETAPRQRQLEWLERHADPGVRRELERLRPEIDDLDVRLRLPLIEMSLAALAELTADQYAAFRANVTELCRADDRLDLFEGRQPPILGRGEKTPCDLAVRGVEAIDPPVG